MSDEITWVKGPNGMIPFNIQTEAGREIWTEINLKGGSGYWGPLGNALPLVEAEAMKMAEERIIALLDDYYSKNTFETNREADGFYKAYEVIKGETKTTGLCSGCEYCEPEEESQNDTAFIIHLTPSEYGKLEKALVEPAAPNEILKKLLKGETE